MLSTKWLRKANKELARLASTGREFSAYDIARKAGEPAHPNHWGWLFKVAHDDGLIKPQGFMISSRPSRRGGVCRIWKGI